MTDGGAEVTTDGTPDLMTVHILGLPMDVAGRAEEHASGLTRELTLIAEGMRQGNDHAGLPVRLVQLIEQLAVPYAGFTAKQEQQLADAVRDGVASIDLTYRLPRTAAQAAQALGDILDEADDYCRAGEHLLTLATPDELVAYRRWFLGQFVDQSLGRPAVTWNDFHRTAQA